MSDSEQSGMEKYEHRADSDSWSDARDGGSDGIDDEIGLVEIAGFDPSLGHHLFVTMRQLSSQWSERARNRNFHPSDLDIAYPTPELLAAEARAQESGIFQRELRLSDLAEEDFPCILAMNNGLTALAIGNDGNGVFLLELGEMRQWVAQTELEPHYAGSIFSLKPDVEVKIGDDGRAGTISQDRDQSGEAKQAHISGLLDWLIDQMWRNNRSLLIQLLTAAGISNLMMITLPLFIMSVYDRVIPHQAIETLWTLSLGVIIAMMLDLALRYVRLHLVDAIGLSVSVKLQSRLYQKLTRMPLGRAPRTPGGLADILKELESLCLTGPNLVVAFLVDLPFILIILALIAYLGGSVVLGALVGAAAIGGLIAFSFRASKAKGKKDAQLLHQKTNFLSETIESLEAVKASGAENRLLGSWERMADNHSIASHQARLQNAFSMQATMVASQLAIVLTVLLGVFQIGEGMMTVGNLAATILLVGRVIAPTSNLVSVAGRSFLMAGTLGRARSLLHSSEEETGDVARQPIDRSTVRGALSFSNVSFGFENSAAPVLSDLNVRIEPGEKVGIIGRNGSGKSTFLKLIPRFVEPSSGAVLLNDFNIQQYDPRQLRHHIGYMPQDNVLFDRSLRDNICLGEAEISPDWLNHIGRITGVSDFIAAHPEGYGRVVGPRGEQLSGGERQAVCLARSLIGNADIYVLDEPTSAMDNNLEAHFVREAQAFFADKTLVLTTHRTHLLHLVDRVIWLDKGKVVADGPRDSVLANLKRSM